MPRHLPLAAPARHPAGPVLQAKPAAPRALAPRSAGGAPQAASFSFATVPVQAPAPAQERLPPTLRGGIERLSGLAMDDVRVRRNSPEPKRLGAHAFARGEDIHLGPGQDHHLPHEAWHVVQQKQGRAGAGGGAINADPVLEAEADQMGPQALAAPPPRRTSPQAASVPRAGAVVQPKLMWRGKPVEASDKPSALAQDFVDANGDFMLRDDEPPAAKEIHVLDMSRKYLLGEQHGSGVWEEETKSWSRVAKMSEGFKTMPHEAEDPGGLFDVPWNPQRMSERPLESAHPYLLATLLETQGDLANLLESIAFNGEAKAGQKWPLWITAAADHIKELRTLADDYYKPFAETFEKRLKPTLKGAAAPARLQQLYDISVRVRGAFDPTSKTGAEIVRVTQALDALKAGIGDPKAKAGWSAAPAAALKQRLGFFVDLARMTSAILPAAPQEAKALDDVVNAPDPTNRPDILQAIDPIRETSMAENLARVGPPVLVQLGDAHVDRIARKVGASAVAIHIPKTLSDATVQPQPAPVTRPRSHPQVLRPRISGGPD